MLLGSKGIKNGISKGYISISPFNENQLNPNSYNVRLGNHFYRMKNGKQLINLDDYYDSSSLYEYNHIEDINYHGMIEKQFFVIEPHEFILAHTEEYIGAFEKYSTLLKSRSTIARFGIDVCPSAGFGDVGYVNRWTLEIINNSNNFYVLKPGMKIAQIAFLKLEGEDKDNRYQGAYIQQPDWSPEMMLPKGGWERLYG